MSAVTTTPVPTPSVRRSRLRLGDVVGVGVLGLRVKRLRALLTGLGIAIGIAAMVSVVGISSSSKADLLSQLDALGTNYLSVSAGQSMFGESTPLPAEAAGMIRRVDAVQSATASWSVDATVRRNDEIPAGESGGISVVATEPDLLDTVNGSVAEGTFLNAATGTYPTVVLGSVSAQRLGISSLEGDPLVFLGGHWFRVVGILDDVPLFPDIDRSALIGYDAAVELFGIDAEPTSVWLRTDPEDTDAVYQRLAATANPEAPDEVTVNRPSDALEARAKVDETLTALLLGLGGVALLVGGVGIANVMVISVLERRAEIGVRRALGATRRHIRLQFLVESTLLAGLGGAVGVGLGATITWFYAHSRDWTFAVPATGVLGGIAAALVVGALAGLYPAARAARLAPATAVRAE